jgi:hypothetical protein
MAAFSRRRSDETPLKPAPRSITELRFVKFSQCPHLVALAATLVTAANLAAQHVHVNAGALSTTGGSPLYFVNGDAFVTNSGWVFTSVLRTNGPAIGLFDAGVTFTSVFGDGSDGPPAAAGAQVALVVKGLTGPEGGSWSFWESLDGACDEPGESITFSLNPGETNGTNLFVLSQNSGAPGEDPYGHCHGRVFTMNKEGLYRVTFQLVDVSRNGPGGGPIHSPSQLYQMYFQAGVTISELRHDGDTVTATFATQRSNLARQYFYHLEANPVLDDPTQWTTVAGPVRGESNLQVLSENVAPSSSPRYYRLRVVTQ